MDEVVDTVLLLLDARFKVAPNDAALFEALVAVFAVLLVKLVADPLLDECVLFAAESAVDEVLPPLEALLLGLELPVVPAPPPVPDDALLAVVPLAAVSLALSALFSAAFNVRAADRVLLNVSEKLLLFVRSFA